MIRVPSSRLAAPLAFAAITALLASPPVERRASAQQVDNSGTAGNGTTGSNNAPAAAGATSGTSTAPQQAAPIYGGNVAPTPPGVPLGGGNATESSARPVVGDREDSFDLAPGGGGGGTVFGNPNGSMVLPDAHAPSGSRTLGRGSEATSNATTHLVRRGDTLWGICDTYFQNPYQWPRIWSYNPQIQNPHWIYPNEQVRLRSGAALGAVGDAGQGGKGTAAGGDERALRGRALVPETIILRDLGFVDDATNLDWGSITGAPEDKMFLTDFDELYVRVGPDHDVRIGQELTVFRPVRDVPSGRVIAIQGTVRVDQWNAETRIARAQVTETLDTIERGARIGPILRKFEVVPPVRNDADVQAHVLAAVRPHPFYGAGQVVFLDKGAEAGLRPGNRLFIVRRGDAWRGTMASPQTADRVAIEREAVADLERVPRPADEAKFPEEVVGELRVLNVQKKTATAYLTRSHFEIEAGDTAVARKGY
jgi:hypothetical protein